ncbi:hypothetical protein M6D93_12465 [Jatrophihabitans telluris]|uniref:Uncharacterized protein n=1 Tax=Jatrophihabitans telluris TaxID=2038343 RepID=A0ABY4QVW5_9ACTN|nr:hypothetical protein [Jatrophihabitans telluris]UQX87114.1 hypothetical protein M6D93_12465 [Jatrophihabitans telluris]
MSHNEPNAPSGSDEDSDRGEPGHNPPEDPQGVAAPGADNPSGRTPEQSRSDAQPDPRASEGGDANSEDSAPRSDTDPDESGPSLGGPNAALGSGVEDGLTDEAANTDDVTHHG